MTFDQLLKLAPQLLQISHKHGIVKVYVFGSVARGDSTEQSDVDFLVEMQEGASLFGVGGFQYESEMLLGFPVDVVPLSLPSLEKDPGFMHHIRREAVPL